MLTSILDVGSGGGEEGQIHIYLKGDNIIHCDIDKGAKHLEVCGDAQRLPFKDKSFNVVHASHILEHLPHPILALQEFKRIARSKVIVHVPNVVTAYGTEHPAHLYNWNIWTLRQLLLQVFLHVEVRGTTRFIIRHEDPFIKKFLVFWVTLPLRLRPNQLTAVCSV